MHGSLETASARGSVVSSGCRRTVGLAVAFVVTTVLAEMDATRSLDQSLLEAAQSVANPSLDLVASLVSILGQAEVTVPIALALAVVWWRREGTRGLVPLLVFSGVAVEVLMKYVVPHPGPPEGLSRGIHLPHLLRVDSPYSFPSGHLLRTAFLTALIGARAPYFAAGSLWAVVAAMAVTRVYLAEHWPSDVVGGLLLGWVLARVAVWFRELR